MVSSLHTSRASAKAAGARHYFTGKPCKRGHVDVRLVSDGSCQTCGRLKARKQYAENPEKKRAIARKWAAANHETVKERDRKRYHADPQKQIERRRQHRLANLEDQQRKRRERYHINSETERAISNAWKAENRGRLNALEASRRCSKIERTPGWLSPEDRKRIEQIYAEARRLSNETGIPHHVDHVLPIRGKLVSGLHVPENLQILTATENQSKGNRFIPE